MELKLREQLLVEKCLNTIIQDYQDQISVNNVNALIDLKLDFLSFLGSNQPEEVEYGIQYIKLKYEDIYILLGSMILEYQMNKLDGSLFCKPIPEKVTITIKKPTLGQKIKNMFNDLVGNLFESGGCSQITEEKE